MSGRFIDIDTWERRAQFAFFRDYELPYFNLCADVDVSALRRACRKHQRSFALACWFGCQRVVNNLREFRLRLRREGVWEHDEIEVAITVLQDDDTFRFCYLPHGEDFGEFESSARAVMARASDELDDEPGNDAVIHGTTLPWLRFTSISHPRRLPIEDSTPKITFGKADDATMPVSVEVHHALMDGVHAARFFAALEHEFKTLAQTLGAD